MRLATSPLAGLVGFDGRETAVGPKGDQGKERSKSGNDMGRFPHGDILQIKEKKDGKKWLRLFCWLVWN